MAVPAGPTEKRYTGNGVTTIFTIPFLLLAASDLDVFLDGVEIVSGFTITGAGNPTSTITFAVAPADQSSILLNLNVPFERLNDYQENGDFLSGTVNRDFDRIWQALKQLLRFSTRSLTLGFFDVDGSGWYRAKGNGIRDLADPVASQDAATKHSVEAYVSSILATGQGPINNAANVIYLAPDASVRTVQDLSSKSNAALGAALIGYRGRTAKDRFDEVFNVMDDYGAPGGAVSGGLVDAYPAFQAAFNAAKAKGGGVVVAPVGVFRLDSMPTIQDCNFAFIGAGQEQTILLVNNSSGGIGFTSTGRTGTEWICSISGFTAVSYGTGPVSRGRAVSVVYPTNSFAPATPNCMVDDIHCRGMGYGVDNTANPYFTDGIYIRNASNSRISRYNSDQNSNKAYTGINLDYPVSPGKFRVSIDSFSLQGGFYGIRAVGAIENLLIDDFEIAVPVYGIYCDATGVGYQTPLLAVGKGHINATKYPIFTKNWKSIQLTAPEIAVSYDAATSGASTAGVYVEGCNLLEFVGGSVNNIDSAANTAMVELVGTTNFSITGMTFNVNYVAGKTQSAINLISGTRDGVITGCTGKGSSTSVYAFVFAQTNNPTDDGILVSNNRASGFAAGLVSIDMRGLRLKDNDFTGCTAPTSVGGQPYPGLVIEQNTPFARANITGNSATPNVAGIADGSIQLSNANATTITNFLNPREGQVIELLAGNANTTIQHNANIFLQGSTSFAMGAAAMLTLRYASGVWRELYRRTG
ncbi:hypothetical protein HX794_07665 [Pseudomonas costantinii]|uniref:hypothetical protein n=1 Tax=Pseudomonas costantinii TaxID=168469 RepID=UPI0015A32E60|nr:hypothetical protein [Pseudomonas costantinii]NVZ19512.1 hypothetical protein [Pseudomonas costantinii]